ncbi:RagB/SusD family nutrient uptake outer membrane protein [Formosa haliotis]|uniref:RagB/SusD family nutrient uptake outer membrane protein n=1 Tax=Formosa haliotis TaxID=1555194 RepID=UPI0008254EC4|nr:RagB/SusD family nutrient uptake outer membrane protein [Formosa haliotis]
MKKYIVQYKYLFLLMIGLSIVGCSDLEEEPVGILTPTGFFKTTDDIQTAINATYGHMINEQFWGRKFSISLMLLSDMASLNTTETRRVQMNDLDNLSDNEMIQNYWPRTYQAIAAANDAIEGASEVDEDESVKNPVVAQAYFIRAFLYFHLVRQFGDIPYLDKRATAEDITISKTPADEVYAKIISDLEYAEAWLPETTSSAAIPSKGAATSYLALVHLTMAGTSGTEHFQQAYDYATKVINSGIYSLDSDFQNLFNADVIDGSPEPIFALDYNNVEAEDNGYDQLAPMTDIRGADRNEGGGWSIVSPTLKVYTTWPAEDYRRAVSLEDEMTINGNLEPYTNFTISGHSAARNSPYIAKYARFPGPFARINARATSHNYSMMRYAEVLLIAAEAAVEIGDNASALMYLNQVRARARQGGVTQNGSFEAVTVPASAVPADATGTVTVAEILEERRYELAFEGKRWYDIVRRKMGGAPYNVYGADGLEGSKPAFNENKYLLPLPVRELERNPNLLPQNPGY